MDIQGIYIFQQVTLSVSGKSFLSPLDTGVCLSVQIFVKPTVHSFYLKEWVEMQFHV